MKTYRLPVKEEWPSIIGRQKAGVSRQVQDIVASILSDVREYGDAKVLEYVKSLDGFDTDVSGLKATEAEFVAAEKALDDSLKSAVRTAAENIKSFHEAQKTDDVIVETMPGVLCRQKNVPIDRVGLYIPGGTAPLFSTVLMLAVPAYIAGCRKVIICTPAGPQGRISPAILYAAEICGVTEVYKIGGAVAVGAMAYGTATVPKVDKIFGPGNSFVTEAKQQVSQYCAIDMPAGPSEVMILADDSASPAFVAADFLSQLEHGKDSQAILLSTSWQLIEAVSRELDIQYGRLERKSIIDASILKSAAVLLS